MRSIARWWPVVALGAASAFAVDFAALQPQGYLSDFSRVVDAGSRAELERYCALVEKATGAQIALVTLPTLAGEPVEDVANSLFRRWGIGRKETNEGILLLLVTGDRRSRLEVGYGLEPYLPDGFAGSVLREMRPALRQGQYGEAMLVAAHTIGSRIAQAKGVKLEEGAGRSRPSPRRDPLPWPLILGGLLTLFFLLTAGGRGGRGGGGFGSFLTGLIAGNLMGRGWGGHSGGGGFGGFDSGGGGGGFGGFGGGDSGGGGASSDW